MGQQLKRSRDQIQRAGRLIQSFPGIASNIGLELERTQDGALREFGRMLWRDPAGTGRFLERNAGMFPDVGRFMQNHSELLTDVARTGSGPESQAFKDFYGFIERNPSLRMDVLRWLTDNQHRFR